jgi:hypothetical protein
VTIVARLDGAPRRAVAVGRQRACDARAAQRVRTVRTGRDGRVRIALPRPPAGQEPAVYRLSSGRRTLSLPIVVRAAAR